MSRIQLAKPTIYRDFKRKKFPHVLQVHEKLGTREQGTTALENNRARPPPRTPQRKNQPSRLQAESTTEPARRSQHEDTAARQDSLRQVRTSTDEPRQCTQHNVRQRDRRNPQNGKDHTPQRTRPRTSRPPTRDNPGIRRRRSHNGPDRRRSSSHQEPSTRRHSTSRLRARRDLRVVEQRSHGSRRSDRTELRFRSVRSRVTEDSLRRQHHRRDKDARKIPGATITRSRHTREHSAEVARTNLFGEYDHAHNP